MCAQFRPFIHLWWWGFCFSSSSPSLPLMSKSGRLTSICRFSRHTVTPSALFKRSTLSQGSCQVLKKLRDVKSRLTEHKDRVVGFENGTRLFCLSALLVAYLVILLLPLSLSSFFSCTSSFMSCSTPRQMRSWFMRVFSRYTFLSCCHPSILSHPTVTAQNDEFKCRIAISQ